MSKSSFEIEKDLRELVSQYRRTFFEERCKCCRDIYLIESKTNPHSEAMRVVRSDLAFQLSQSFSKWSGGFCVANLCEQEKRDVLARLLKDSEFDSLFLRKIGLDAN